MCLKIKKHRPTKSTNPITLAKQSIALNLSTPVVDSNSINPCKPITHHHTSRFSPVLGFSCFHQKEQSSSGYRRYFSWDSENRLKEVKSGTTITRFLYDAAGERTGKIGERGETLYFNAWFTSREDGAIYRNSKHIFVGSHRAVTRLNADTGGTWEAEDLTTYYYHPDHLGSVSVVSDRRGDPYERIEYTPYGEMWQEVRHDGNTAASKYIPYRFTAKEWDEETGLYYHGARYYEPRLSRWISADPAGFGLVNPMDKDGKPKRKYDTVESMNWYSYVANNPNNHIDPSGRLFFVDDVLFWGIGKLIGQRNDKFFEGVWSNFTNSWLSLFGTARASTTVPWTAPVNIGGFLASYFAVQIFGGTVEFDGLHTYTFVSNRRWGAFSLGFNIVAPDNTWGRSTDILTHERGHTKQAVLLGIFYYFIIAIPSILSAARELRERDDPRVKPDDKHDHREYYTERWADMWKWEPY